MAEQRYLIWKACHEHSETWQAEQQRIRDEANRKRSEATKEQPRTEDGTRVTEKVTGATTTCGKTCNQYAGSTAKAKASKTNRGTVERMDRLADERPADEYGDSANGERKPPAMDDHHRARDSLEE